MVLLIYVMGVFKNSPSDVNKNVSLRLMRQDQSQIQDITVPMTPEEAAHFEGHIGEVCNELTVSFQ